MVIRISRRALTGAAATVLAVAALVGLYFLGRALTPVDGSSRPVLLSPSVWAAEKYRRSVQSWLGRMERLDASLEGVLALGENLSDPAALYWASDQAQSLVGAAADLYREVEFSDAPIALLALREQARTAAREYWKAAVACAQWVGAPEEPARKAAMDALEQARREREALERSRWLR